MRFSVLYCTVVPCCARSAKYGSTTVQYCTVKRIHTNLLKGGLGAYCSLPPEMFVRAAPSSTTVLYCKAHVLHDVASGALTELVRPGLNVACNTHATILVSLRPRLLERITQESRVPFYVMFQSILHYFRYYKNTKLGDATVCQSISCFPLWAEQQPMSFFTSFRYRGNCK
jgi:hypothetical protein